MESDGSERFTALKRMVESEGVPTVDPNDLAKLWKHMWEVRSQYGEHVAIDIRMLEKDCSPGANVNAVWFRASTLALMAMPQLGFLDPWMHDGEPDPVVFRVMAEFEFPLPGPGDPRAPFSQIVTAIRKAAEGGEPIP